MRRMNNPVVIDTSVFISGILTPSGNAGLVLKEAFENQRVLFSEATFDELKRKLHSPKFARYITTERANRLLTLYSRLGSFIEPQEVAAVSRDQNDDMFLALAKAGDASAIISLDKDLLVLNPWESIEIIKPAAFLVRF